MKTNRVAENVLGTLGTICWTIQLLPQIWKSWRTKDVKGLSSTFIFMWGMAGVSLGVYNITQNLNIPLIVQPELFTFLILVSWGQCQYYGKQQSRTRAFLTTLCVLLLFGGLQASLIFAIRPAVHRGNNQAIYFFGILSAVLISLALLPQYYEIYKHKEVIGISITFMIIDLLGGVFSDLSLAFKERFDIFAAITYSLVVALDAVVIIAAVILNPRARRRRESEARVNQA